MPDGVAADQAIQFVITGDRNVINYNPQHATGNGTNVTTTGAGLIAVTGSQTASGAGSSVAGTQATNGEGSIIVGAIAGVAAVVVALLVAAGWKP